MGKAFWSGFYWPTMVADAEELVRCYEGCQFFAKQIHVPSQALQTILVSWPFACWGLDMVGPFKKASGGYDHILVAVDKFTKWIEVKPIKTLTAVKVAEFIGDIVHRFGVPNRIITDLGTNFTGREFQDYCDDLLIKVARASVAHPRTNGQVERANGVVLEALKKCIFDRLKKYVTKWLREFPAII